MAVVTNEELDEIKKTQGETIGGGLSEDFQFILRKEGEAGLKQVEAELANLGYPLKLAEIKNFQWYPFYLNMLLLVVTKNIFQWTDADFRENGRFSAKVSVIVRIMVKYFVSLRRVCEQVGSYWRKYYTMGAVNIEKLNEKEKVLVIAFSGFTGVSSFCRILEGYIQQIFSYVVPGEKLTVQEIECVLQGGKAHRFKLTW